MATFVSLLSGISHILSVIQCRKAVVSYIDILPGFLTFYNGRTNLLLVILSRPETDVKSNVVVVVVVF